MLIVRNMVAASVREYSIDCLHWPYGWSLSVLADIYVSSHQEKALGLAKVKMTGRPKHIIGLEPIMSRKQKHP